MRRERQRTADRRNGAGTQGAFDFTPEASVTLEIAKPSRRRAESRSASPPQVKESMRGATDEKVSTTKQTSKPRLPHVSVMQEPETPKVRGAKRAQAAAPSKVEPVQAEVTGAATLEVPAKRRTPRKVQPDSVTSVDVQTAVLAKQAPTSVVVETTVAARPKAKQAIQLRVRAKKTQVQQEPAAELPQPAIKPEQSIATSEAKPKRVRQAKQQVQAVPEAQTVSDAQVMQAPEPTVQPQPRKQEKKRSTKVAVADVQEITPVTQEITSTSPKTLAVPGGVRAVSETLPVLAPSAPIPVAPPASPPTWRYVGNREEADRLYRRRFGTENVPEPTLIAGALAYALPAMRRQSV